MLPRSALLAVAGAPERHRRAGKANGSAGAVLPVEDRRALQLAARMRLLEGFLSRTEVADASQHALQWLGEVLEVRQSLCLIKPSAESSLFTVASHGFAQPTTSSFVVSLESSSRSVSVPSCPFTVMMLRMASTVPPAATPLESTRIVSLPDPAFTVSAVLAASD